MAPPRKDILLKYVEGTEREDRDTKKQSVVGKELTDLKPPRGMSNPQKKIWKRTIELLVPHNLMSALDVDAVVGYCRDVVMAEFFEKQLGIEEYTQISTRGSLTLHRFYGPYNETRKRIAKFHKDFGMTPVARVGLEIPDNLKPESKPSTRPGDESPTSSRKKA